MTNCRSTEPDAEPDRPMPDPGCDTVRAVSVGKRRLRVAVRQGTGDGLPLLLCGGIGVALEGWAPFLDALDPALSVIRFDVPGVGGSAPAALPYRFSGLARLVTDMLTQLGHRRFDVLGVSWGGALAQQLAFANPQDCRRAVLVATATGALMIPPNPWVLLKIATPRRHRDAGHARSIAGEIYGGSLRAHPDLVERLLPTHPHQGSVRGYLYQLAASAGWTSLAMLPRIRQRTLVLAGSDDPIIPLLNARIMTCLLPNATLHVYDEGHLGILIKADELAEVVSGFLTAKERP
jgi:poly(3-hydroxyalkanoate) depolymerase